MIFQGDWDYSIASSGGFGGCRYSSTFSVAGNLSKLDFSFQDRPFGGTSISHLRQRISAMEVQAFITLQAGCDEGLTVS